MFLRSAHSSGRRLDVDQSFSPQIIEKFDEVASALIGVDVELGGQGFLYGLDRLGALGQFPYPHPDGVQAVIDAGFHIQHDDLVSEPGDELIARDRDNRTLGKQAHLEPLEQPNELDGVRFGHVRILIVLSYLSTEILHLQPRENRYKIPIVAVRPASDLQMNSLFKLRAF